MGYANHGIKNNATMVSVQFLNIGTTVSNDLQTIIPTGDGIRDAVKIQTLNEFGQTIDTYLWVNGEDLDTAEEGYCWADLNYTAKITGVSFGPGDGLWVYGTATSQGIQTSGQVGSSDVAVKLRNNATSCGNPFPTKVDLQDLIPSGDGIRDAVKIQTLNEFGQTIDTYLWVNGEDLDTAEEGFCWADLNYTTKISGVEFAAGDGFFVYGTSDSQYLTFPAPEL